jgi:uncharacterized protein (DUF4415 family)
MRTSGESSRRGVPSPVRDATTGKHQEVEPLMKMNMKKSNASRAKRAAAKAGRRTDWSGLRRRKPGAIRKGIAADPDAHATNAAFWKSAQVVLPTPKEAVTMRLDADLLRWFRRERGYQTRINAILRAYMQPHKS